MGCQTLKKLVYLYQNKKVTNLILQMLFPPQSGLFTQAEVSENFSFLFFPREFFLDF